jgi:peroxiredoxin
MRKYRLLYLTLALLAACTRPVDTGLRISGEIKGMGNDTIYLCGTDRWYDRMDTLVVTNDKFKATLSPDTFATALLLFRDGITYPLFLQKRGAVSIKGSADNLHALQVKGNTSNAEMTEFNRSTDGLTLPSTQMMEEKADSFIARHPASPVSIYLLDKYFVQTAQPDMERIKKLAARLTGELQDTPYMEQLLKQLDEVERMAKGKMAPFFRIKDTDDKEVTRSDFKDQYLLIHFWASWDSLSRADHAAYRRIYRREQKKKEKDRHFALLGISLDTDRAAWRKAIATDTLQWTQACDAGGWNSDLVKQYVVRTLPDNLLLAPTGRIEARGLNSEAVEQRIEEIDKQEKEKEQRKQKQERERLQRRR